MKNNITRFAILLVTLILTQTAFADVKIKTRQTASGQSFETTTYIKGKRTRSEQSIGGMQTVNIIQCDLRRGVRVMPQAQTYIVDSWQAAPSVEPTTATTKTQTVTKGGVITMTVTTKDTGERKQMFGYTARHIITTMETNSSPDACNVNKNKMQFDGWYIDKAFGEGDGCGDVERYSNYRSPASGCQDRYVTKQIGTAVKKGYPVSEKMTMLDETGKEISAMQSEVVEISNQTLDAALFDVPNGYREVKDSTELYASMSSQSSAVKNSRNNYGVGEAPTTNESGVASSVKNMSQPSVNVNAKVGEKKAGVVRIGLAHVKTGGVGEGLSAGELAGAVQNTLAEYLKSPSVELVALEAKLPSAVDAEAKSKECDYVIYANVSHKKGGGGFGMFKKLAPVLSSVTPLGGMGGSVAGAVAGSVASTAIYTAAGMAGSVKSKDEITLDIKINQTGGAQAFAKQYKQKAKGDGDDIISPIIEQAAQAILDVVTTKK